MQDSMRSRTRGGLAFAPACLAMISAFALGAGADTVIMKNGVSYRTVAAPDRDGETLLYLWDGTKKIVVRDSKVDRVIADNSLRTGEKFSLVQPLTVHAGAMPREVVSVAAEPWDEKGRRKFRYIGRSSKPVVMEQAINEIGPHVVRFRGVDGFWQGQAATRAIPRDVLLSLLHRVERDNQAERERVVRFMMEAGWNAEARAELEQVVKEFPDGDLAERAANARRFIIQAEATQRRSDVDVFRRAKRFKAAAELLKTFDDPEIDTDIQVEVREQIRREDDQRRDDRETAHDLLRLQLGLSPSLRETWKGRLAEVRKALDEAPDAVRDRLAAWRRAKAESRPSVEAQLALAMSGYVVGIESAVPHLAEADALWTARDLIARYLRSDDEPTREAILADLDALKWPPGPPESPEIPRLELAQKLCRLMPPPFRRPSDEAAEGVIVNHVEAEDSIPTTYHVQLPPEYHPLRSYPAVVVMHSGDGPEAAVAAWGGEAARRGYIVIAPEHRATDGTSRYQYTPGEHAAVELAVRDARRRYAVDSDRVFAVGQLGGGEMAWDVALGHPDLFAGVAVVSGLPGKYVPRSMGQHERLPLLCVIGDLAPASTEVVFNGYVKPMIQKVWDVTYMEMSRRGLEEFPEEIPTIFDWMEPRRRDPYPKAFDANAARSCDDRRHGIVVRAFAEGRTTAPEAVEPLGRNLSPATIKLKTSSLGNLLDVTVSGVTRLDVWAGPELVDFRRKLEVRVNRKTVHKTIPRLEFRPMLEDLRVRGDRGQMYWVKIEVG
ncbi:PHB depolymerase family esterase [Paludisphaera sp.]|uniref:carboxylesterase family protein n=1 Tax=Paludisphaera sp. TaxID=2017432 RepID=UPI00301C83A6